MDPKLLQKYFRNRCSVDEIEQVLNWFDTPEGQKYLEDKLTEDAERYSEEENLLLYPNVPGQKMYRQIKSTRKLHKKRHRSSYRFAKLTVASVVILMLTGMFWIFDAQSEAEQVPEEITYRTFSTESNQHRLITLEDGTQIRLNSNSLIRMPSTYNGSDRMVELEGEAWFDVAEDIGRTFYVEADQAVIEVLGTEFNIKIDDISETVQIAVAKGKVSLYSGNSQETDSSEAILTKNSFAIFQPANNEILIEQTPVENYLSWINGRLYFYDDPLWMVSRYLQRLYNIDIEFEDDLLRNRTLSLDLPSEELDPILETISSTLNIGYTKDDSHVEWTYSQTTP